MPHKVLPSGTLLHHRYRIERLIKSGGFAAVYVAIDERQRKRCAVKETFDPSTDSAEQFRLEADILAGVRHDNLPPVWDYFQHNGGLYLVMEFIEGEDLESHLEMHGAIPEDLVRDWVEQLCDALTVLHRHQPPIIHRDIKPANIKITPDGRAVLVDFGIAKLYHEGNNTQVAARAVTDGFSPLEQYGQGSTDARSDIYALGATMYNLLTGIIPPDAPSRVTLDTLVPPTQLQPSISAVMEHTILRSLALRPSERFQSAEDMRWALAATLPPQNPIRTTGGLRGTGALSRTGELGTGIWLCPVCLARNTASSGYCVRCGTAAPTMPVGLSPDMPTLIMPSGKLSPSGALQPLPNPPVGNAMHGWAVMAGPAGGVLHSVAGKPGQGLVACGERGLVLVHNNDTWLSLPSATSYTLHAIATAPGHIWAVGDFGTVVHFTNGRWSVLQGNVEETLHAIALDSSISGWIAGTSGALIDLRDLMLEPLAVRRGQVRGISINDLGDGWAVGKDSLLLRLTQGGWKARTNATSWGDLWAVDHANEDEAWAVGVNGLILHIDNAGWQVMSSLGLPTLRSVAFNRRGQGWAVGELGAIAWFDGQSWSVPPERPASTTLRSVAWLSDDEAWVIGDHGVVLRWRR
jgi:serine/threonine-protein kinase